MGNTCNCNNGDKNLHDLQPEKEPTREINKEAIPDVDPPGVVPQDQEQPQSLTNRQLPAAMTHAVKAGSSKTNKERGLGSRNAVDVHVEFPQSNSGNANANQILGIEQRIKDKTNLRAAETSKNLPKTLDSGEVKNNFLPVAVVAPEAVPHIPIVQQEIVHPPPKLLVNQQLSPVNNKTQQELKICHSQAIQTSIKQEESKVEQKPTTETNQNNPMSPGSNYKASAFFAGSLFERLGGDDGLKLFIDRVFDKVVEDPELKPHYVRAGLDISMVKDKYRFYFTHLTGGAQNWIGCPVDKAHSKIIITDKAFDQFNSICIQTLKEMRKLKVDGLKQMIGLLQGLRDNIVMKEEVKTQILADQAAKMIEPIKACPVVVIQQQVPIPVIEIPIIEEVPKSLFQEMGGMDSMKAITLQFMKHIHRDASLSHFFQYTDQQLHIKRLTHYFAHVTGSNEDWIGMPIDQAHQCRFISHEDFDIFIESIRQILIELKLPISTHDRFIDILVNMKNKVVFENEQNLNLWQQLNFNEAFGGIISTFVAKLALDDIFSEYFSKNAMMKHIINQIVTTFFGNDKFQNGEQPLETYNMRLTDEQFKKSKFLFNEALQQHKVSPLIILEAMAIYAKLEHHLVREEDPIIEAAPPIITEKVEDKDSEAEIEVESVRGPADDNPIQLQQNAEIPVKIQDQCNYESLSKISEPGDQQPIERQASNHMSINLEQQQHQNTSINHIEVEEEEDIVVVPVVIAPEERQNNLGMQLEQLMEESERQDSRPSPIKHSQTSPAKSKRPEIEVKYNFYQLLDSKKVFEGELSRHVERQKTKISRWLVLKKEALLIYKDKLNSMSFPERPLQCVPLMEIESIKTNEIHSESTTKFKKQRTPVHYELEITLRDQYCIIAAQIGQLFTDYTLAVLGNTYQQSQNETKMTINNGMAGKLAYHASKTQVHGFSDSTLIFLSTNKKDITQWHSKLKTKTTMLKEQVKAYAIAQMQQDMTPPPIEAGPVVIKDFDDDQQELRSQHNERIISSVMVKLTDLSLITDQFTIQVVRQIVEQKEGQEGILTQIQESEMKKILEVIKEVIQETNEVIQFQVDEEPNEISQIEDKKQSVFERVGGAPSINALVEGMYAKIFTDPELSDFFRKTDKEHQKEMQRRFLTYATGGSNEYNGLDMGKAHAGRGIGSSDFNKVASHVISTLNELGVSQDLIDEIVALLVPLKSSITEELPEVHPENTPQFASLFARIGGESSINALVDGMYQKIFNDPELSDFFRKTDHEHQREMQRQFLTFATGGSSEWKGKSMSSSHHGRGIGSKEFGLVAGHVVSTLQELQVTEELINEIVQLLIPLKASIVDTEEVKEQIIDQQVKQECQQQLPQTIFERVGGQAAIAALVDGMYAKIFTDPELSDFFRKTDKEHQKEMQRRFLTYATGGQNQYNGLDMGKAHAGRGIMPKDFDKVAQHVVSTLQELQVPTDLINEIVALLVPLKAIIVEEQSIQPTLMTLYQKLGGSPSINALVDGMYAKIFTDPELSDFFRKTDKEHQKEMQRRFLTYATGGSNEYNGLDMGKAHAGRGIGPKDFDRVAQHVVTTLQELSVPQVLIDETVALLLPLKSKIADEQIVLPESLFERLGGAPSINALVDGMYHIIFNDPDLTDYFRKTDKEHQREMQRQFLTFATGGSSEWKGKSMSSAHHGRGIGERELRKVVDSVVSTLRDLRVSDVLIQEVVALLLPLKGEVVDEQ